MSPQGRPKIEYRSAQREGGHQTSALDTAVGLPLSRVLRIRRRMLQGVGALAFIMAFPPRVNAQALPSIPALDNYLAGRVPLWERLRLDLPRLADNGLAVPIRLVVSGPFAPGPFVRTIRLFSETNPVPDMAVFDFPQPVERIEIDSRIRLASTQHVVAIAQMTDGRLYAAVTEVVVTLAGCMDGT